MERMTIAVEELTPAQARALEDFLYHMQIAGQFGTSRWVCFYADGESEDFHPKVKIGRRDPEPCREVPKDWRWKNGRYMISPIWVELMERQEKAKEETKEAA